jgi:nitroreductase
MTHAETLDKILREFLSSPDGYTMEELRDIYLRAKTLKEHAAFTIVEFHWEEKEA